LSFPPNNRLKFIMIDIDHIDPRWEEGRDYQMVCGWNDPLNYCEREHTFNLSKSNRFLPWRVISDEIGTIPVSQGDLCLFLVGADIEQDIPGEWVLMEFLSEEWFTATRHLCGPARAGRVGKNADPEHLSKRGQKGIRSGKNNDPDYVAKRNSNGGKLGGQTNVKEKKGWFKFSTEERSAINSNAGRVGGPKVAAQRWMCTVTGFITNAGSLTGYQRKRGIDTSNRIRLE
jgi:hypothetical protein